MGDGKRSRTDKRIDELEADLKALRTRVKALEDAGEEVPDDGSVTEPDDGTATDPAATTGF